MSEEFNLSERVFLTNDCEDETHIGLSAKDVKEFIKRLKEQNWGCGCCANESPKSIIDRLAGDELK